MDQRYEQFQKDMQEQMTKFQQELKDQMIEAQRDMIDQMTLMMNGIANKGKDPITSAGEESEDHPPGFTPPHGGWPQKEFTSLEQPLVPPPARLGQGVFASNQGANPADPIVPDLDDPMELTKLKMKDQDAQDKYKDLEERLRA
ncbi:putative 2-oxoglutarate-dependent dioxygenase AOP1.2 [Gossypium australe]|uniref:Putative 2-oxoglutarate-dependent dioxygenase AOP1.2 n=1 Tax=Gossypium australe TaxID=47621 RepID=A0A5B6WQY1_9ROSI|nr:putative 2-oxoglutarate-dependent dioxygenase AOP1.2 [Gossypium australe]